MPLDESVELSSLQLKALDKLYEIGFNTWSMGVSYQNRRLFNSQRVRSDCGTAKCSLKP